MKFSRSMVASLITAVAAGNLRAYQTATDSETVKSRVTVSGLLHLPTQDELVVLDKIVQETYNDVFASTDLNMVQTQSTGAILLASKEVQEQADQVTMIISDFVARKGKGKNPHEPYCWRCPPPADDDDWECYIDPNCTPEGPGTKLQLGNVDYKPWFRDDDSDDWECYIDPDCDPYVRFTERQVANANYLSFHKKFEGYMCKNLRASGVDVFSQVQRCSFTIVEEPGSTTTRVTEENAYEAMNGRVTDVELSMIGLTQDLTKSELKFLEDAVVEAHNNAFAETGYQLKSFSTVSFVDTDDAMNGAGLFFGRATPIVLDEPRPKVTPDLADIHQAFEVTFCTRLQNSGLQVFAHVNQCLFRFVYNPFTEVKENGVVASTV